MSDTHLTLRLPTALARALARWARERRVSKSQVVREAVARYLSPPPIARSAPLTAGDFAARWALLPRLSAAEAESFEADIVAARVALPPVRGAWE